MEPKTGSWHRYVAPGRICLYGEHQDYLHLTVVPAAISLQTQIAMRKTDGDKISLYSRELDKKDVILPNNKITLANNEFDYFRAIILALFQKGMVSKLPGFDVTVQSDIPIGSGLSSSAALLVAWLTALNYELELSLTKREIANVCFLAEHDLLKINCGIMDQYAASLGGIFALDCSEPPYSLTKFAFDFPGLVIGDSKLRRKANNPLTLLKQQLQMGLKKLAPEVQSYRTLNFEHLENKQLTAIERQKLYGILKIREITKQAIKELQKQKNHDLEFLGRALTEQHTILAEYLGVSIPKLDLLVKEALTAGALGAKLTGAGLGGCIVAFAPGKEAAVAKAIERAGGKALQCNIDFQGARKMSNV